MAISGVIKGKMAWLRDEEVGRRKLNTGLDKPPLYSQRTSGSITTLLHYLWYIFAPQLRSEIKLLAFCGRRNIIACVNIQQKVFLSSLALMLLKAVCLWGRLVQRLGTSLW